MGISLALTGKRVRGAVAAAIALWVWLGAGSASAQVTCSPSINPPGTPAPGTVIGPGVRVISTQWGLGNCPTTFFISARAMDGTIWATDYNDSLWKSADDLRAMLRTYTATGYAAIDQVLPPD